MRKPILILSLSLAALTACSKHSQDPARNAEPAIGVGGSQQLHTPLLSALERPESPGSCARQRELSTGEDTAGAGYFSYLGQLSLGPSATGALAIEESPLTQFLLGESFKVPDWESFYEDAKKEHAAGKVGGLQWFVLNMMNFAGYGKLAEVTAINDKLSAAFPGIFGEPGSLDGALHWQLAQRAARMDSLSGQDVADALTRRIPLFPGNGRWGTYAEATKASLAAALRGLRSGAKEQERLCSLVLLHQSFAQLLRVKGYVSPVLLHPKKSGASARIAKLTSAQPDLQRVELSGAFFDLSLERTVQLKSDDIKSYDPSVRLLTVADRVPLPEVESQPGVVGDALAFMESLLYAYEASSPASPWAAKGGYLYGDLQSAGSPALLPAEAHQLSLGLLIMQFKNLSAAYLKKVNAQGALARAGEIPAGIALVEEAGEGMLVHVRLDDAIRLAYVATYFENAIRRLEARPAGEWQALNPVYDEKTLALLLGRRMFGEEELAKLLTPEQRASVLADNLDALKLPLVLLMSKLAGSGGRDCLAEVEWNLSTGRTEPVAGCGKAQKARLADVFELLGRDTSSPLLLRKAEALRE